MIGHDPVAVCQGGAASGRTGGHLFVANPEKQPQLVASSHHIPMPDWKTVRCRWSVHIVSDCFVFRLAAPATGEPEDAVSRYLSAEAAAMVVIDGPGVLEVIVLERALGCTAHSCRPRNAQEAPAALHRSTVFCSDLGGGTDGICGRESERRRTNASCTRLCSKGMDCQRHRRCWAWSGKLRCRRNQTKTGSGAELDR